MSNSAGVDLEYLVITFGLSLTVRVAWRLVLAGYKQSLVTELREQDYPKRSLKMSTARGY